MAINKRRKKTVAAKKLYRAKLENAKMVDKRKKTLNWAQVHNQYILCYDLLKMVDHSTTVIGNLIKKELSDTDRQRLTALSASLLTDRERYTADLLAIYETHKDKTDDINEMEIMDAFVCYENYVSWFESFNNNVVSGTVKDITLIAAEYLLTDGVTQ